MGEEAHSGYACRGEEEYQELEPRMTGTIIGKVVIERLLLGHDWDVLGT